MCGDIIVQIQNEVERVCVFDLDGTLWKVNSHIDIVENFFGKKIYSSIIGKLLYRVMPRQYMKMLNHDYARIPQEFIDRYNPIFRQDAIDLLEMEKSRNSYVMVISNAPVEILATVQRRLGIDVLQAEVGKKDQVLKSVVSTWSNLLVVTDNLTDASLLELATEAVIYTPHKRKKKFLELSLPLKKEFRKS